MTKEELVELLADAEHSSWSRWMCYVFDIGKTNEDGSFTIPAEYVQRWLRQCCTQYKDLSEREKQSDRDEVAHILPLIREYALSQCGDSGELAAMAWGMANAHTACISDLQRQVSVLHDEVFCTDTNRPATRNKTLLGDVRELYRLVYSLQGEDTR